MPITDKELLANAKYAKKLGREYKHVFSWAEVNKMFSPYKEREWKPKVKHLDPNLIAEDGIKGAGIVQLRAWLD